MGLGRMRGTWLWLSMLPPLAACSGDHAGQRNASSAKDSGVGFGNATGQAGMGSSMTSTSGTGFGNASGTGGTSAAHARDAGVMSPGAAACVGSNQNAQMVEVDMYIMLDRSDSMTETTGSGATKWDAMSQAITSFVNDPMSAGLGVGLQYFPLGVAGIPDHCMTDSDCTNAGGPCGNKACQPPRFGPDPGFTPCYTVNDCPLASPGCVPFGVCSGDSTYACLNIGANGCQAGNPPLGDCVAHAGSCRDYATCDIGAYQTPDVPIALLPGNAKPLTNSLTAHMPAGLTPTPAALTGAINQATSYAKQNPTHRVVTVLATDGLPTDCVPPNTTSVDQAVSVVETIASQGVSGTPSISTYVIGVFSSNDGDAMTKLDGMAAAGGTKNALIVDVNQDVGQQFLAALASIRSGILDCDFELPMAPSGQSLDFSLVNVEFDQASGTQDVLYVKSMDQCSKASLGWYYDVDPSSGQTPTKISVCPQTCDTLRAATGGGSVKINLGCQTKGPE